MASPPTPRTEKKLKYGHNISINFTRLSQNEIQGNATVKSKTLGGGEGEEPQLNTFPALFLLKLTASSGRDHTVLVFGQWNEQAFFSLVCFRP